VHRSWPTVYPLNPTGRTINGRTCTVAASILLLRRYTERHDFTARVYDDPSPTGAAPGTGRSESESAAARDCVDVRVAFDDDASAMRVLLECNRAMSSPIDAANGAPDVIIATLRPGEDPDLAADALHAELEPDAARAKQKRATNVSDVSRFVFLFRERRGALTVRGNTAARRRHDVEKTPGHLNVVLAALGGACASWDPRDAPAAATPLITAEELRGLRAWNDASYRPQYLPLQPVTRATTLPARIAEIAAAHPTAPAVSLENAGAWTYLELTRAASRLASRLRRSLGPSLRGERVGVYLERGPLLVASLIAVHLAGAAYVPLDPLYPADRVGSMLADSNAVAVISSAAAGLAGAVDDTVEAARRDAGTDGGFEPPVVILVDDDDGNAAGGDSADFGTLASAARPTGPRLRHLHLRLDRSAQGREGDPRQLHELHLLHGRDHRGGRERRAVRGHDRVLRHRRIGALPAPLRRRPDGSRVPGNRRRSARAVGPHRERERHSRASHPNHVAGTDRRRRGTAAARRAHRARRG
jgi:hypothetical protein